MLATVRMTAPLDRDRSGVGSVELDRSAAPDAVAGPVVARNVVG
jgi:hypothetical protein